MPTLQCPSCGKAVKFEGIAGVCPHCAAIVRASKPPSSRDAPAQAAPRKPGRVSRSAVDLDALEEVSGGEEAFEPASTAATGGGLMAGIASLDKRLLYAIFGAIALVAVFGLYVVFRNPSADDSTVRQTPTVAFHPVTVVPAPDVSTDSKLVGSPQPAPPILQPKVAATQATSRPAWMTAKATKPTLKPDLINDQLVEQSIRRATAFLKSQFKDGALIDTNNNTESKAGGDALAVYALLNAGQAIEDPDLGNSSAFVREILDAVRQYPMDKGKPIYERSLRAAALSMLDREPDRDQLSKDRQWLLKAEVGGAYGYELPPPNAKPESTPWDNSTSQYGVLGVWSAAAAGQGIPDKYWADVEKHWLGSQFSDGGWAYTSNGSTATMTFAGITTLCVTAEYESASATTKTRPNDAKPAFSLAVNRGLEFLTKNDTLFTGNLGRGYALYTVERAGLATGFRWFGNHDWYREIGAKALNTQLENGSWSGEDGVDVETSFVTLFLSRGRQPLLMDKLRFAGDWDNRPRDVAKLTQYASAQLEKPFAWGVADLNRDWWDWLESPVLFISTDTPPTFSDEDCNKLRSYAEAGGLIFLHNEFGSKAVDAFATDLSKRLFPNYPMTPLPTTDLLYSAVFPIKAKPILASVSNGTRTLMIYSPKDITQEWVRYRPRESRENPALQLGLNMFVDGAGKSDFRNRLNSPYVGPVDVAPLATVPVYRISYPGAWNPEPGAWLRFARLFQSQTSLALDVIPTDVRALNFNDAPVAILTGNADLDFSKLDLKALRKYVSDGGVLIIDSTGGSKAFAAAVKQGLFPLAFPGAQPSGIPRDHPILAGTGTCMDPLPKPRLRNYTASLLNGAAPGVQYATFGKGTIVVSDLDLTTGLLNSGTYGIYGYTPAYCQSLVKNVLLWTLNRYHT